MMRCGVCNVVRSAGDGIACGNPACPLEALVAAAAIALPEREASQSPGPGARREPTRLDQLPSALLELIELIPPPGDAWPVGERRLWLIAFAAVADVIYGPAPLRIDVVDGAPPPRDEKETTP